MSINDHIWKRGTYINEDADTEKAYNEGIEGERIQFHSLISPRILVLQQSVSMFGLLTYLVCGCSMNAG